MISKNEAKQQITSALQQDTQGYSIAISDIKRIANIIFIRSFGKNDITRIEKLQRIYSEVMNEEFGYALS